MSCCDRGGCDYNSLIESQALLVRALSKFLCNGVSSIAVSLVSRSGEDSFLKFLKPKDEDTAG